MNTKKVIGKRIAAISQKAVKSRQVEYWHVLRITLEDGTTLNLRPVLTDEDPLVEIDVYVPTI